MNDVGITLVLFAVVLMLGSISVRLKELNETLQKLRSDRKDLFR